MLLLQSADFFQNEGFQKFRYCVILDPDQAPSLIRSGLGPNCLQRLSHSKERAV